MVDRNRDRDQPTPKDFEDSKALDSPWWEARQAVGKLTKENGITLMRYYFARSNAEAQRLCMYNPEISAHVECEAPDDVLKKENRTSLGAIMQESKAKIRFIEVSSVADADTVIVEHHSNFRGLWDIWWLLNGGGYGYTGRTGDKSLLILSGDLNTYDPQRAPKRTAHEIEHSLGAKHINDEDASNPVTSDAITRSIMSWKKQVVGADGKILGPIDISWYQRHFGKMEDVHTAPHKVTPKPIQKVCDPGKKEL